MPKAIYKICREGEGGDPVLVTKKAAFKTSAQTTKPFLCDECEQRFSLRESAVIDVCLRAADNFPLRTILQSQTPRERDSVGSLYHGSEVKGFNLHAFAYFALSILWRSSATRWKLDHEDFHQNKLGPYQEMFRTHLLGNTELPSKVAFALVVFPDADLGPLASFPMIDNQKKFHFHNFLVPGMEFRVFVGNKIPKIFLNSSRPGGKVEIPIFVNSFRLENSFKNMVKMAKSTPLKGKLATQRARIKPN